MLAGGLDSGEKKSEIAGGLTACRILSSQNVLLVQERGARLVNILPGLHKRAECRERMWFEPNDEAARARRVGLGEDRDEMSLRK